MQLLFFFLICNYHARKHMRNALNCSILLLLSVWFFVFDEKKCRRRLSVRRLSIVTLEYILFSKQNGSFDAKIQCRFSTIFNCEYSFCRTPTTVDTQSSKSWNWLHLKWFFFNISFPSEGWIYIWNLKKNCASYCHLFNSSRNAKFSRKICITTRKINEMNGVAGQTWCNPMICAFPFIKWIFFFLSFNILIFIEASAHLCEVNAVGG